MDCDLLILPPPHQMCVPPPKVNIHCILTQQIKYTIAYTWQIKFPLWGSLGQKTAYPHGVLPPRIAVDNPADIVRSHKQVTHMQCWLCIHVAFASI